jgi:hypothetical protein
MLERLCEKLTTASEIARWLKFKKTSDRVFGALASLPRSSYLDTSARASDLEPLQACVFRARGLHLSKSALILIAAVNTKPAAAMNLAGLGHRWARRHRE